MTLAATRHNVAKSRSGIQHSSRPQGGPSREPSAAGCGWKRKNSRQSAVFGKAGNGTVAGISELALCGKITIRNSTQQPPAGRPNREPSAAGRGWKRRNSRQSAVFGKAGNGTVAGISELAQCGKITIRHPTQQPPAGRPQPRAQRSGSRLEAKKFPPECSFRRSRKRNGGGNF